uniref:Vitellogenin n=1 Tax=Rhipicephalus appendiculatus TaxID=34631 RepID=A0A131YH72_RHIAP
MLFLVRAIPLLLLAAAANAILLDLVPTNQSSGGVVYEVRATMTLESPELNVDEGTRVQYAGELVIYPVGEDKYQARFLNFSMVRYKPSTRTACPGCSLQTLIIAPPERSSPSLTTVNDADRSQVRPPVLETLIIAPPERRYPPLTALSDANRSQLLGYPVQFVLKSGKVVEYEISLGAPAWINSVYKTVLTLLQNQVETPRELPDVSSYYEDGVSGYCRVTYEVHSQTNLHTTDGTFNVTKTKHLDDCQQRHHVDSESNTRGHPADRTKHLANNLLPLPLDDTSENQTLSGRPEGLNTVNSEVPAHEVSYYSVVNGNLIESALSDSLTVLPLITGPALVRAQLQLKLASHAAPPRETMQFDGQPRTSLKLNLSEVVGYFNSAAYSDLVVMPEVFTQLLDEVAEELATLEFNIGTKKNTVLMLKLVRIVSLLSTEQLKQAMPPSLLNKTSELEPKEQLLRALYIDLLGNARSKSSVEMALHLMKEHILSRQEAARLFRDLSAFFMTYIDEDTRELFQDMCRSTDGLVDTSLRAATCSSLAEMAIKVCPPGHLSH